METRTTEIKSSSVLISLKFLSKILIAIPTNPIKAPNPMINAKIKFTVSLKCSEKKLRTRMNNPENMPI
jgi:hypothetical protein